VLSLGEHYLEIREVRPDDAAAIVAIYNHFVLNTTISFEESPVSEAAMRQRMADVADAALPRLVAEIDGVVAGYAYATKWRARAAYRFAVESSVYVDPAHPRKGVGSALYAALIDKLSQCGRHTVIGGIALPNAASVALHEKFGFVKVAHFAEVGLKFDRWIDVGYWQLTI